MAKTRISLAFLYEQAVLINQYVYFTYISIKNAFVIFLYDCEFADILLHFYKINLF